MYESINEPLLSRWDFIRRMGRNFGMAALVIVASLILGSTGYCYFGNLTWDDGLLNAAMILTGMGPVAPMTTTAGKLFATFYALYSGIAFLTTMAVIMAPLIHRFLHEFHIPDSDDDSSDSSDDSH